MQSIAIIRPDRWFVNLNFMSTDFPLKGLNLSIKLLHWKDLFFLLMILMMSINSLVRIHFFKAIALGITGIARHLKLEQMSLLHPDLYITWKKTFFFFSIRNILQSWIVLLPCQTILVCYLHLQLLWLIEFFSGILKMCTCTLNITFNEKRKKSRK